MSKKKIKNPSVKAVPDAPEEDCTSDICNECRGKMIDEGICPDCGGPIGECGGEEDTREFDTCIMVKIGDEEFPMIVVTCEGRTYVGAVGNWDDENIFWLANVLTYSEFLKDGTLLCGFQKPIMNLSVPEKMAVRASTIHFLRNTSKADMLFVQSYMEALQRGKTQDAGLVLPNANPVPGLQ